MRTVWQTAGVVVTILACCQVFADEPATSSSVGKKIENFSLPDYRGKVQALDDFRDAKALVVAFVGAECPLAKVYAPRLATLASEYESKGVKFLAIDSNLQDSLTEIAAFARIHNLSFPVLKDMSNKVADAFGAMRTPEVFLLDQDRVVRYGGRIDDQYGFKTGAGYAKPRLARRDLAEAIDEVLAGKPVSQPVVKADGCLIGRVKREQKGDVTYSNQIARILQDRCQVCHRAGEVAPFAMDSYDEIVGWGEMIREVVDQGRMPPWYANPAHGKFANDARLSDEEKQQIVAWVENGCPEGDRSQLPPPRQFAKGWRIGQPDEIIYMSNEPCDVPAEGTVAYKYFTVDPGWSEDKWVQATESRPGDPAVVHHIIVFIMAPGAVDPMGAGLGGYAPGNPADVQPPGTAIFVPKGSKLLFQMHYTPNGTASKDRSSIGVVFADPKTVKKQFRGGLVGNMGLKIPPGAPNYEISAQHRFRRDTVLLNLTPHMHLRGKDFRYVLNYPDGKSEILLDVPAWDFNWQLRYDLAEPKLVPKGAVLKCIAHYDNSADNLANPDPKATVRFGDQTWEEMMFGFYASIDPNEDLTAKLAGKAADASDDASTIEGEDAKGGQ
ncbi:MAG: redoxin domain-containing protein [Planctomycetia bacterium]|nr:redoxin domain-containing protein [Planctomycetia bacterium]